MDNSNQFQSSQGDDESAYWSVRSRLSFRSLLSGSVFTNSTGARSQYGSTWKQDLILQINSGFASGAPRSENWKPVREGREKGGYLPRIKGVGRTGKGPAPVPKSMLKALGVTIEEEEVDEALLDGIEALDPQKLEIVRAKWTLKFEKDRFEERLEEKFSRAYAQEDEIFKAAKTKTRESRLQVENMVEEFRVRLKDLRQHLDDQQAVAAQTPVLQKSILTETEEGKCKATACMDELFERRGRDIVTLENRLPLIMELASEMYFEDFELKRLDAMEYEVTCDGFGEDFLKYYGQPEYFEACSVSDAEARRTIMQASG